MQTPAAPTAERPLSCAGYGQVPNLKPTRKILEYNAPFLPLTMGISTIDAVRVAEIDNFYQAVQLNREQSKDRTGNLHPLRYFEPHDDDTMTKFYLCKYPVTYVQYKSPPLLPWTHGAIKLRPLPERKNPSLHSRNPCIAWKF